MDKSLALQIEKAKQSLLKSGVVCFPTETVMGLGVVYNDFNAYNRLNVVKERPEDKPYTMMVKSIDEIAKYAFVDEKIERVIKAFMPGSLTLLLKAKDNVPSYVTHGTGVIGVRIPTNLEAVELLNSINLPLLVPSANKSGQRPALNSEEAKDIFKEEVDVYIEGCCLGEEPSTIIYFSKGEPKLIRQGPLSFEGIKCVYDGHKFEETVMCYLFNKDEMLMIFRNKKEVDINKGKWIGVGGHIEKGETPDMAMSREFFEETNAHLENFKKVAKVTFLFKEDIEIMHVYVSEAYTGEIDYNCNEGTLDWIKISELDNIPMWEGDKYFIKPIINNEPYFEMLLEYEGDKLLNVKKL